MPAGQVVTKFPRKFARKSAQSPISEFTQKLTFSLRAAAMQQMV
jgi:hypothetical protein